MGSCSPEYLLLHTNRGTWRTEIATNICIPLAAILQGAKYNKMWLRSLLTSADSADIVNSVRLSLVRMPPKFKRGSAEERDRVSPFFHKTLCVVWPPILVIFIQLLRNSRSPICSFYMYLFTLIIAGSSVRPLLFWRGRRRNVSKYHHYKTDKSPSMVVVCSCSFINMTPNGPHHSSRTSQPAATTHHGNEKIRQWDLRIPQTHKSLSCVCT